MRMLPKLLALALGALGVAASAFAATNAPLGETVVVRAGTIHVVEGGEAITGGGAIVIRDGKIVAVGTADSIEVPAGAQILDYGADAVVVPGLIAADSSYGRTTASPRTADPSLLAIDQFDPYSPLVSALRNGITTVYLAPARGRLIAGQGAVVKSGGGDLGDPEARVLNGHSGLHGSVSEEARQTPGYWEPPVPATVDVGLGLEQPQLPKTTMGAILAIDELMAFAGGDESHAEAYGPLAGPALAKALEAKMTWRMGGETAAEVQALLDVKARHGMPLVIDGAGRAASLAGAIAKAGVPVIARPYFNNAGNFGKGETANWPSYDHIARLAGEGVDVAIAAPGRLGAPDLRLGAALAMRGGLSKDVALAGITINAARVLGVSDRVGSLTAGKDADIVVMSGDPLSVGSAVLATMIDGTVAWTPEMQGSLRGKSDKNGGAASKAMSAMTGPVVISVDELHVGNGVVHSPGEVLIEDGKIAEVSGRVGRPSGARIVRGAAAMPGMIDAYGHLGTEGGSRPFSTQFKTARILEPGDYADRQVAKHGVTTVNLISRSVGGFTPSIAYKPAASSFDDLVIDDVASVRMQWDSSVITQSGAAVRQQLKKATDYVAAWEKYEAAMAKWTPPAAAPASDDEDKEDEKEEEEEEDEESDSKKKKKKKERDPAKPVTGVFEGTLTLPGDDGQKGSLRMRFLENADGSIEGTARAFLHDELLTVSGKRDGYDVTLTVSAPDGDVDVTLAQIYSNDPKPKSKKKSKDKKKDDEKDEKKDDEDEADKPVETYLRGEAKRGDDVVGTIDLTQTSTEYKVAKRPVRLPVKAGAKKKTPKGQPKAPNVDADMEVLRRAMAGEAAVLVTVNRDDQILACVDAFEAAGIRPILFNPRDGHKVADQIAGRVAGCLIPRNFMEVTEEDGTRRNRLVEISSAGIPVAFFSEAEEGAAELGVLAGMAVARGLSPTTALKGLTSEAASMLCIDDRVGTLEVGKDADVLVLDGSPLELSSSVKRTFVSGAEVR